jgi:hypothetical protein
MYYKSDLGQNNEVRGDEIQLKTTLKVRETRSANALYRLVLNN